MVDTLKLTLSIEMSMNINSLLYFLKKLPVLKGLMKNIGYEHNSVAKGFVTVSIIYEVIKMVFKIGFLLLIGIILPLLFVKDQYEVRNVADIYYHLFLAFYLLLPFCIGRILSPSPRKFICVKVMRMNAKNFIIADYVPQDILRLLVELVTFFFVAKAFELNIFLVLLLIVAKHCYTIAYEAIHVASYHKTGKLFHKRIAVIISYMLVITAIGYAFPLLNIVIVLPSFIVILICALGIALGIFGGRYLLKYPYYDIAINEANLRSELSIDKNKIQADAMFKKVKLEEGEYSKEELAFNKFESKSGYEYLNAIFFQRHKRILIRPILIQLAIVLLVFLITGIVLFVSQQAKETFTDIILKRYPVVILLSYIMSTGLKATKAMFYNCDISLLRYGFYREKGSVLTTFTLRARNVIVTNLIPSVTLAITLFLLELISGGNGRILLPVELLVIMMSVFFSVHNMVLYYLFQPYTTDLNVKNPAFSIINFVTYFFSYVCFYMDAAPENFLFYTVLGTAIYIVLSLFLVYWLAPKRFTIK